MLRTIFSALSFWLLKSGNVTSLDQSFVFPDIGLENDSLFYLKIAGSNVSGTELVLFNKKQYRQYHKHIKSNDTFCSGIISDSIYHFHVTNESYNIWEFKVSGRSIYHPVIFNCNNQNFNYSTFFVSGGIFLDMRERNMPHILSGEFILYGLKICQGFEH